MGLNLVFKILVSKNYFGPAKGFHVHFSRTFWKCGAKVWRGAFSKYPIGGAKVKGLIYYGGAHLGKNPIWYTTPPFPVEADPQWTKVIFSCYGWILYI